MKKNLINLFAVSLGIFISVTTTAQQAEEKPKVADLTKISEKERTKPTDPAIEKEITQLKVLTADDQPKPIVPGGEFKPVDTDKPFATDTKTPAQEKNQPILMPASVKAGPPPVVTEQNADPAARDRAKPAPLQVIAQKQQ